MPCPHGKRKATCKECGGSAFCKHGKQKPTCKECGGSAFCKHGKWKAQCKECGGSALCKHGKQKTTCKECGGSGICEHGKQKAHCKECGGSAYCKHGKHKTTCKECGGSAFCKHGKWKAQCKECGGSALCKHGKQKTTCKECGGSAFCKHGKQKPTCKECGGSGICEHGKRKDRCKECGGSALCKTPHCETTAIKKYNGHCMPCCVRLFPDLPVSRNYKTKENQVVHEIKQKFPDYDWIADKTIQDGCSARRPDLILDVGSHIIIIEVDENRHTNYDCSCEHKRLMLLSQDVGHRPIVFIRFNPDSYKNEEGVKVHSCWKLNKLGVQTIPKTRQGDWDNRIRCLCDQIHYWFDNPTQKTVEIIELFY